VYPRFARPEGFGGGGPNHALEELYHFSTGAGSWQVLRTLRSSHGLSERPEQTASDERGSVARAASPNHASSGPSCLVFWKKLQYRAEGSSCT